MRNFLLGVLVGIVLSTGVAYVVSVNSATGASLFGLKESKESQVLSVKLINTQGEKIGTALLTEESKGVRIQLKAEGLTPGKHGFHIHEQAFSEADLISAGGHFNPTGKKHGRLSTEGHHLGDLDNLIAEENGTVEQEVFAANVTLKNGHPYTILGKSLIIHAGEDDGQSDPAGNSGDRVAGGNILP